MMSTIWREVWKGGVESVLIGFTKACQQNGGEGAAGKTEVVVPRCRHAVDVDRSRSGIAGMICGHIVGGAIAINRLLACPNIQG